MWPEATTFLTHRGAYSRPEAATIACGQRPQGFMSQMSRLKSGHLVTQVKVNVQSFKPFSTKGFPAVDILVRERSNIISLTHVGGEGGVWLWE